MSAQDKANNDNAAGRGPANCTYILRAQGKAYPRTCARCGLGPCPFYRDEPAPPMTTNNLPATQEACEASFPFQHLWSKEYWLREAGRTHELSKAFQRAMNQAAEAERERCAKVATDYGGAFAAVSPATIAAAIRTLPTETQGEGD